MVLFDIITDFVKDFSEEVRERIVPKIKSSKQTVGHLGILYSNFVKRCSFQRYSNSMQTFGNHEQSA